MLSILPEHGETCLMSGLFLSKNNCVPTRTSSSTFTVTLGLIYLYSCGFILTTSEGVTSIISFIGCPSNCKSYPFAKIKSSH